MRAFRVPSSASAAAVWTRYAEPRHWSEWAPHVRGAWGLAGADGRVRAGARGAVRLLGVLPVPARITAVDPGRSWSWRVGPVAMRHAVEPRPAGGCTIVLELSAPGALEAALAAGYGPLVVVLLGRLAARAAASDT